MEKDRKIMIVIKIYSFILCLIPLAIIFLSYKVYKIILSEFEFLYPTIVKIPRLYNLELAIICSLFVILFIVYFLIRFKSIGGKIFNIVGTIYINSFFWSLSIICFISMIITIFDIPGMSYTEDLNHYLITDLKVDEMDYFPEVIEEDMYNVKYKYYYDNGDYYTMDIFLKAQFKDKEILDSYIDSTVNKIGKDNLILLENEGDDKYMTYYLNDSYYEIKYYEAGPLSFSKSRYLVYGYMFTISYSYEDNSIIWNYLSAHVPITINDYTPSYFIEFNIPIEEIEFNI